MFSAFCSIFSSDKKLTSILVIITFFAANIISVKFPSTDPRSVTLEINLAYAAAEAYSLPGPMKPYRGGAKSLSRSFVNNNMKEQSVAVKEEIAVIENRVDFDSFTGNTRASSVAGVTAVNYQTTSSVASDGRDSVSTAQQGITNDRALITSNNQRQTAWENDTRSYQYNGDLDGHYYNSSNERNSVARTLDDLKTGEQNQLDDADEKKDDSNKDSMQSIMMLMMGIAMIIAGIALLPPPTTPAGVALIIAGIMMILMGMLMGAGPGNKAGDESEQAGTQLNDGLDAAFDSNQYVRDRLRERDTAAINYSPSGTAYSTYGRGDVRNKIVDYRNSNYRMIAPKVNQIQNSRRGRSSDLNTVRSDK